ncbi:ABC transporter substrate-binding protein [Rhodoplanes roseus]|uniref:Nitrate ABC transporter substrate-binding protein n=1 Tax=Rhodoplanes roseus TaxID=29409 RepID=A0A327L6C0_9BRAD|nr:ABC transporter substrate-binding protein [Rhodoplanes roseus]RAI45876.1 nitrate ABC transporter substrate-binding protein [Rhodoplanes roseus]
MLAFTRPWAVIACLAGTAVVALGSAPVRAEDKVTILTSWYAQAEHGGFYQAVATGIYKKYGLDVTVRMGGPQINGMQILGAEQTEFLMSYDFSVYKALEQGVPAVTVATSFQSDLQGLMTHPDVKSLADLKGKSILVATAGRSNWWPWMKAKFGYTDEQTRTYTFNLQPFLADPNAAQQAYMSSEPFAARQAGAKVNFFLFANDGYPPYGTTIVTLQKTVKDKPDMVQRFVKASMEGWKSYIYGDPAPANALIQKDNPKMSSEQIAYAIEKLRESKVLVSGDAATQGIGVMTDARWKATYDFMVKEKLLKPEVDMKAGYTLQFVKDMKVMP